MEPKNKITTNRLVIIYIAIISLVVAIALSSILILPYDDGSLYSANSSTNYAEGGYVAADSDNTYYSDFGHGIRIVNNNSLNIFAGGGNCFDLAISGDKIYFMNGNIFYVSSKYISNPKILIKNCTKAEILGNWIYYVDLNNNLLKMRKDGTAKMNLHLKIFGNFTLIGDNIYYAGIDRKIYTCLSDGKSQKIFVDYVCDKFSIEGNMLIYLNDKKIYVKSMQYNLKPAKLVDAIDYVTFTNQSVVGYVTSEKELKLYDLNLQPAASTATSNASVSSLSTSSVKDGYENSEQTVATKDGKTHALINTIASDGTFNLLHSNNSYIYYYNEKNAFCQIKMDGTSAKTFDSSVEN